jgi:alkanesulfonate monooxygenase SsuD/methylene tetrahydromethanopterin reductase-like flavin-dependent oxidoreductase (luciferase family)
MLRRAVETADASGIEELWLWEDCFDQGAIASAACALAWTERLRVGIGVLPVPLRNPVLTAMEIATLERTFPHRVHVALGHGMSGWMRQAGSLVSSPMTLLREYVEALRAMLDGKVVTTTGRYLQLQNARLTWPPSDRLPLHLGAIGPKTIALAGELADGIVLPAGTTPAEVRRVREIYDAARGGRKGRITMYLMTITGPDSRQRFEAEARAFGLDPSADVGVAGGAEEIRAAVQRWTDAGADAVILQPGFDVDPGEFAAYIGEQVSGHC